VIARTGAFFIHPYNDINVIMGQATAAMELIEDTGGFDIIIAPVGGGGLISGTAIAAHYMLPDAKIYAGEPFGADDAYHSLRKGEIVPSVNPETIADGLRTSLGDKTFPIIKELVTDIIRVEESEIIYAMRLIWERMKIIVEPSGAVPLAAVLREKKLFARKRIGIILSGGNVDLESILFKLAGGINEIKAINRNMLEEK
jgi:threonine dehydratase